MNTRLTPEQISVAAGEISQTLLALERVSIMLQVEVLEDPRDIDAMHTVTQHLLQRAGLIAELVAVGCGNPPSSQANNANNWQWMMPPSFFPTPETYNAEI